MSGAGCTSSRTAVPGLFFTTLVHSESKPDLPPRKRQSRAELQQEREAFQRHGWRANEELAPLSAREESFRHGGWKVRRAKILAAMIKARLPQARIERFKCCGSTATVEREKESGRLRVRGSFCHDRHCVPCAAARACRIRRSLAGLVAGHTCRFITFTLKHRAEGLAAMLDRLLKGLTRIREQKIWTENVRGGAYFIEVKRGKYSGRWHVHAHVLCDANWIDAKELSACWKKATGDSWKVDIQIVRNQEDVNHYVTKYVTKGMSDEAVLPEDDLDECLRALSGRRLCTTFGSWRGTELDGEPAGDGGWEAIGRLEAIICRAERGDLRAQMVIAVLTNHEASKLEARLREIHAQDVLAPPE